MRREVSNGGTEPRLPPHWPKDKPFPWPEWEATCPGCGRFHRHYFFVSGELCRCAYCHWMGDLKFLETA